MGKKLGEDNTRLNLHSIISQQTKGVVKYSEYGIIGDLRAKTPKHLLLKKYSNLSLLNNVKNKYPSIKRLIKEINEEEVIRAISILIADVNIVFSGDLSKEQIIDIAYEISTGFLNNLSLEDLFVVVKRVKHKDFYKLKPNFILNECQRYIEEKMATHAQFSVSQHQQTKTMFDSPRLSESRKTKQIIAANRYAKENMEKKYKPKKQ